MSIASRITAITGHITDIYDTLELGGDTTSNKNIVNINTEIKREYKDFLANGTDTLWNNWEKASGEGTELSLNNTMEGKMKVDLKGNTQQNGTPTPDTPIPVQVVSGDNTIKVEGKNLLNVNVSFPQTDGGLTISRESDGKITISGTATSTPSFYLTTQQNITLQPGTYTLSEPNDFRVFLIPGYKGRTFTLTEETTFTNAYIAVQSENVGHTYNESFYPMLVKGSTLGDYEPYQSQTYPINLGSIELCKIGDYQDYIRKSTGKNLWNESTQVFTNQARFATSKDSNNVWTFTITGSNGYAFATSDIALQAGTYTASATVNNGDFILLKEGITQPNTFTLTEETTITFRVYKNGNVGDVVKLSKVMIEKSSTATEYEPYGKVWYLHKETGKYIFDENGNWIYSSGWSKTNTNVFYLNENFDTNALYDAENKVFGLANNFQVLSRNDLYNNDIVGLGYSGGTAITAMTIRIDKTLASNLDNFKTWLSNNNITYYYMLKEPVITEITDTTLLSQLEALAYSYEGTTNISQVNDDMLFILDITALKEMA